MTEEIKSGSKLLAEFEGFSIHETSGEWIKPENGIEFLYSNDELTYHTDYNELHRVWTKLRDFDISNLTTEQQGMYYTRRGLVANKIAWNSREKAFSEIVDFVTWYNSLKPKS